MVPEQCYKSEICSSKSPLNLLQKIYKSVNLMEAGLVTYPKQQWACAGSWAFSLTSLLENNILLIEDAKLNSFWQNEKKHLDLSEQWALTVVKGSANGCNAGEFTQALNYLAATKSSVELEANYPQADPFGDQTTAQFAPYKLTPLNYLLPF